MQAMVLAVPMTEQVPMLATSWSLTSSISTLSISPEQPSYASTLPHRHDVYRLGRNMQIEDGPGRCAELPQQGA